MSEDASMDLVSRALAGDGPAARELLASVQDRVYNLALRFLGEPEAARDACQDICLKAWSRLGSFRGESRFSTWVLAIAANHLRDIRQSRLEEAGISFEAYEAEAGAVPAGRPAVAGLDERLLAEELRHSCSLGMLQCLDRSDRLVYVLHAFFGVSAADGGLITGLSPAAYRQRLSRTRRRMAAFLARVCGLAGQGADCRCRDRVLHALAQGRISAGDRFFTGHVRPAGVAALTGTMETLHAESAVFRAGEGFRHPDGPAAIRSLLAELAPALLEA